MGYKNTRRNLVYMMILLFLKSLFIPYESFIEKNMISIKSLINSLLFVTILLITINAKVIVRFEGWITPDVDHNIIIDRIKLLIHNSELCLDVSFKIYDTNYGKKYMLKNVSNLLKTIECDIIIYADHDIVFTESSSDYISILITKGHPLNTYINHRLIKVISFNQDIDRRHHSLIYANTSIVDINDTTYCVPKTNIHVATGCFISDRDLYDLLKFINIDGDSSIYGDEDILIGEMLDKQNMLNLVTLNHTVQHPYETDTSYVNWKMNCIFQTIAHKFNINN